jgi:hypothetical protein
MFIVGAVWTGLTRKTEIVVSFGLIDAFGSTFVDSASPRFENHSKIPINNVLFLMDQIESVPPMAIRWWNAAPYVAIWP